MKRLLLILVVAAALFAGWEWFTFPDVTELAAEPPRTTAFMERRRAQLRSEGKSDELDYRWVPYSRISPYLRRAVLVAEDGAFYQHEGVDVEGIKEALRNDWKKKQLSHGGSTITQQLAKNLYLSPSRNPYRKFKEFLIARSLERHLTKKRIFELYLNVAEFGERVYGAEAAAQHYFDRPASALTPRQAALLAGCLPNPRVMNPASPNKRLRARQRMILSRMRRWGSMFEREVLTERRPAKKDEKPEPVDTQPTIDESVPEPGPEEQDTAPETTATSPEPPEEVPPSAEPPATTTAEEPPPPSDTPETTTTAPPNP